MSIKNKERNKIFQSYFLKMAETAGIVDPIIIKGISEISSGYEGMKEILYNTLKNRVVENGVRPKIRPFTARMGYEICGGENWLDIASACASAEMMDANYYAADDIFDIPFEDPINKKVTNEKVVASHIFRTLAYEMLWKSNKSAYLLDKAEGFMQRGDKDIYQGFWVDIHMKNDKDYWEKVEKFSYWDWILSIGASLADASDEQIFALQGFGKNLGMAWTLANDTVDFAKKCEDIRLGRRTWPVMFLENTQERSFVKEICGKIKLTNEEMTKLKRLVVESGLIEVAKKKCVDLADKGIEFLGIFPESESKDILKYTKRILTNNRYYKMLQENYGRKSFSVDR